MTTHFNFKYTKETCPGHYYYTLFPPFNSLNYVPKGICVHCGYILAGNDFINLKHLIDAYPIKKLNKETSIAYTNFSNYIHNTYKQIQINKSYTYNI